MSTSSEVSASTMRFVSRENRGARNRDGPSASAESTSSRAVNDFDPGIDNDADKGPAARGAAHGPGSTPHTRSSFSYGLNSGWEYFETSIVVQSSRPDRRPRRRPP